MGTWIYHLRITEQLLHHWPELDTMAFTCGNLAPDSGRPAPDWSSFDPSKATTHFFRPPPARPRSADLDFYRAYLQPAVGGDADRYAFRLGYFCHLLADNLWIVQVEPGSRKDNPGLFSRLGASAWNVLKEDWYDLDRLYLAAHPECLYWRFASDLPRLPRYLDFIDWDCLYEQYDYMRNYYQQPPGRPLDRSYPYLNSCTMDRCVAESSRKIAWLVDVLAAHGAPPGTPSALVCLDRSELRGFPPPLGDK